jgi:hypothetical protein
MLLADYADYTSVLNLFYMWLYLIDNLINSIIFCFLKDYFITES